MITANLLANHYQLIDQLGVGSMGVVYRAVDRLTGETLALKRVTISSKQLRFASRMALDEAITRRQDTLRLALAQEFKTLAGLRHPHIISVIDYGFDDERQPFFTMALLEDARHLTTAGHEQPLETQVKYLIQTLQALAYLHRRDILHRDIKPGNVLVAGGRVRVLDFGLSIERQAAQQRVGTASYMAPETIRTGQASTASDLYAVGILAYEMWAGRHPFDTGSKRLLMDILNKAPALSLLPEPVRPVVARLLAKDPAERYADAWEAIRALTAAIGQSEPEESAAIRESFLQAAAFVGRDAELGQLADALEQATRGRGSAWLVGGESGVGKSRLLDELRTLALVGGAAVLRGQAVEDGRQAYQLWREPLRHLVLMTDLGDLQAGVLRPLFPDIEALLGRTIPAAPELEGEANQQRLHLTIADICRAAAQAARPLVLLLEDLHWAAGGLEPLKALNRLVADLPLLVIGSYRSEERPDLPAECPAMNVLPLARLSPEGMAALSASMLGAAGTQPQVLDLLQKETEGNTFFLVETVRALAEEAGSLDEVGQVPLPQEVFAGGVRRIIQRRLERVPEEHRPLLKLASVAGRALDLDILQAAIPQADIETWLTTCMNVAVLEVQGGNWRFTHDRLRNELTAALAEKERRTYHRQAARAYERVYPGDPGYAATLTAHWDAAGDRTKTAHYARLAGEYAATQYANDEAARHFSRALALVPEHDAARQYELRLAREAIYGRLGQREAQASDLEQLTTLASTPALQIDLALRYGAYHNSLGEYGAAIQVSEQAYRWAVEKNDRENQSQALIIIAQAYQRQSNYEAASQYYNQAFELARLSEYRLYEEHLQVAQAHSGIGEVAYSQGDYPTATKHHQQALEMYRELDDLSGQVDSLHNLGQVANAQGDYEAAREYLLGALKLARQVGDRPKEGRLLLDLGMSHRHQGAYAQAGETLKQSLVLAQATGDKHTEADALRNLGVVAYCQKQYGVAIGYCEGSLTIRQEIGDRRGEAFTLMNLGVIAKLSGQYEVAIDYYKGSLAIKQEIGDQAGEASALNNMGYLTTYQGQHRTAIGYLERSLIISQEIGARLVESSALNNLGLVAYSQGQYERAQECYQNSLAIKQEIGTQDMAAYTLNNLGALALAQSDFQEARAYLQQAYDIRQELDLPHLQIEDGVGLALATLRSRDRKTAVQYAIQFIEYWSDNPTLEGTDQPIRTFHFAWQVCRGLELPQTADVLTSAVGIMQTHLDNHPDPDAQAAYLAQPHHQALWTAWQEKQNNE